MRLFPLIIESYSGHSRRDEEEEEAKEEKVRKSHSCLCQAPA